MYGNLLSTMLKVTIDQGDLISNVITSWKEIRQPVVNRDEVTTGRGDPMSNVIPFMRWNKDLLDVNHPTHDIWVAMKPPKAILRKSSDMQRPIQRVRYSKAIALHTKIGDQIPSLEYVCPGEPHQRIPNAPKFEDRSQEERVARARCPWSTVEVGQKYSKIEGK